MFLLCKQTASATSVSIRCFSSFSPRMNRTYSDAIASLNTLQSNFAIVQAIRQSRRQLNELAIPEMIEWCNKIGYQTSDFDGLNAIHVAGTKGKGSTSAFTSSILMRFLGQRSAKSDAKLSKIGLYTSPHLRFVRERIQINGEPLTEEQFTRYFFEIWDRLEAAAKKEGRDPSSREAKPQYFRYLTLMAYHCYLQEGIDAAVIECGIGGEYDSTNVLQHPVVTGITNLGLDHVAILGDTLEEIAWHKAGIMKAGSKCYTTVTQPTTTKPVLEERADERRSKLVYVDVEPKIQTGELRLGLQAEFQKVNASLAAEIARDWLLIRGYEDTSDFESRIAEGLEKVRFGGRCETRKEEGIVWCIDGGHTLDSIKLAGQWFADVIRAQMQTTPNSNTIRHLIFNQQTRDADALAQALHDTLAAALDATKPFTHAIFCTNTTFKETGFRPDLVNMNTSNSDVTEMKVQRQLAETWSKIDPSTQVRVVQTIEEAIDLVRSDVANTQMESTTLVTGSLHLVGGFLEVLESTATQNR